MRPTSASLPRLFSSPSSFHLTKSMPMFSLHLAQRHWLSILSSQLSHSMNFVLMLFDFLILFSPFVLFCFYSSFFPFILKSIMTKKKYNVIVKCKIINFYPINKAFMQTKVSKWCVNAEKQFKVALCWLIKWLQNPILRCSNRGRKAWSWICPAN